MQRVSGASVSVPAENYEVSAGKGLLVLAAFEDSDTVTDIEWMSRKICSLRIFDDSEGVMNLSVKDIGGDILCVSQFTLYGNCRKGRRPSFTDAAPPQLGEALYEAFLQDCADLGFPPQHGSFGADMQVASVNDGPVTLILDTEQLMDTPRRK